MRREERWNSGGRAGNGTTRVLTIKTAASCCSLRLVRRQPGAASLFESSGGERGRGGREKQTDECSEIFARLTN